MTSCMLRTSWVSALCVGLVCQTYAASTNLSEGAVTIALTVTAPYTNNCKPTGNTTNGSSTETWSTKTSKIDNKWVIVRTVGTNASAKAQLMVCENGFFVRDGGKDTMVPTNLLNMVSYGCGAGSFKQAWNKDKNTRTTAESVKDVETVTVTLSGKKLQGSGTSTWKYDTKSDFNGKSNLVVTAVSSTSAYQISGLGDETIVRGQPAFEVIVGTLKGSTKLVKR